MFRMQSYLFLLRRPTVLSRVPPRKVCFYCSLRRFRWPFITSMELSSLIDTTHHIFQKSCDTSCWVTFYLPQCRLDQFSFDLINSTVDSLAYCFYLILLWCCYQSLWMWNVIQHVLSKFLWRHRAVLPCSSLDGYKIKYWLVCVNELSQEHKKLHYTESDHWSA